MAEDHETPEVGRLPRAWDRGRRETKNCQRAVTQRVRSWTVQNERGVLGCEALQEGFLLLPILER